MQQIRIIDSHTGGEPTRVVVAGGPDLGGGSAADKLRVFQERFDRYRSAIVNEPRGSDVVVGALLIESANPSCAAGVIFFNNVGYLGMCGHGTIGVVTTLAYLGRLSAGVHRIETPVGTVDVTLHHSGAVSVRNVPIFRWAAGVTVTLEDGSRVTGEVAWGGNWFFLTHDAGGAISPARTEALTEHAWRIRQALERQGVTGRDGAEIDHVELFGPSDRPGVDSKSFVLCPGKAYDRSPCGTGTSAKLACLYADGKLQPGQIWRQESVIGSVFEGTIEIADGAVIPTITGTAYIHSEGTLLLNEDDPYCWGIPIGVSAR